MSSPTTTARLIPRNPEPGMPDAYPLKADQTTVGRHPSNDIVLALDSISRFHARIDRRGDFFILQDLNSSNGSMVNAEKVTQIAIHDGDQVTFGNVEFDFTSDAEHGAQPSTPSYLGKDIVDFEEDQGRKRGGMTATVSAEDVAGKTKSSVISSVIDKKTDKATMFKLNQRLSALYTLSEMLREVDLDKEEHILQRVLEIVFMAVKADRGVILTRPHKLSEEFDVTAVKYRDDPIVPQKVKVSRTILNQVLTQRVAVLSKDAQFDERFNSSESIVMNQIRSTICAPMIVGDDVLGVVHVDMMEKGKTFEQDDLEFVMIVASETGVSLAHMRMQKEAMHRERLAAVGETVAGISHNVKNILLLSQGGAELLTRALSKDDMSGAKDAWQVVSRGIDKIGRLVREMLEYSSHKRPDLSEIDLTEMICGIAEEIEDQLVSKGVSLELDLDEGIGKRLVDQLGLQRTLMNLFVNSMEAISHKEGTIFVSTSQRPDKTAVIVVRDNGAGISKDKLERIFLPFYTTKGSSGTGLGLPMCRKCIEDMGGTIDVESEENVGTTFTIEIPLIEDKQQTVDEE